MTKPARVELPTASLSELAVTDVARDDDAATSHPAHTWIGRLRRWWKLQMAPRIEDEVLDAGGRGANRMIAPVLTPLLIVPAILVVREPSNQVAFLCLLYGAIAILYALISEAVERRTGRTFWAQLVSTVVYVSLISAVLWTVLVFDHPRPHVHWVIFFLYFLLVGAMGMSDDPRHAICAGGLSVIGYSIVLLLVRAAAAEGRPMAVALSPQLEWVANSAKLALLVGATVVATSSAARGRALRRMSLRDGLTGLLNRHAFDRCLSQLAARTARQGREFTIAMIDIDHFKALNDTYGHATGDVVLRWVATRIERSFRATDVVARFGGEEFVVAFPDTSDARILERLERLRSTIADAVLSERRAAGDRSERRDIRVTVSIGMAGVPGDVPDVGRALELADQRLYEAKRSGRNCIASAG